jgi:hypothetical protein
MALTAGNASILRQEAGPWSNTGFNLPCLAVFTLGHGRHAGLAATLGSPAAS